MYRLAFGQLWYVRPTRATNRDPDDHIRPRRLLQTSFHITCQQRRYYFSLSLSPLRHSFTVMSDPGPSRSRARGGDRLPTSGNSAPARVARPPDESSAPAAIPGKAKKGKKRRHRPGSKGGPSPAGQSTSSAGPSTTEATGGKRKRRQGASEPTPSDDDGSNADADTDNVGSAVEEAASIADEGKGKERDRRGRSKRSRSSVELEPGQATSPDEAGPSTTSPFFASSRHAAGRLSAVGTPTTEAEEDLEEVEVNLAASRNAGSLPLSALALGLRTAASPAPPGSPARSSRTSPVKVTTVSPTKHIAKKSAVSPAAVVASTPATAVVASPAKPSVDPALRERAVRLKLIEDLAKEKREREQEVAGMREEMDQLRKEVGFKDSVRRHQPRSLAVASADRLLGPSAGSHERARNPHDCQALSDVQHVRKIPCLCIGLRH